METNLILAVDIGTTAVKTAIFNRNLNCLKTGESYYQLQTPDKFKVQIDPNEWWKGFIKSLKSLNGLLKNVSVITISANTPGFTTMDSNGNPLYPSIIHMDRRSKKQAKYIMDTFGKEFLLKTTGNLPMLGGCSACSILWIKENYPEIYKKVYKFGHTNTFIAKKLTGNWAIDPTNTSLTCLYNTTSFGGWNKDIINELKIKFDLLPEILSSENIVGKLKKDVAIELRLKAGIPVLIGANDAICATYGAGVVSEGQILDTIGTTELFNIVTNKPIYSQNYSLRAHVVNGKWCTIYILNTCGKAVEWFFENFYKDMDKKFFFKKYLPEISKKSIKDIPKFIPYLCGDRYSIIEKSASFTGIRLNMNREDFLLSILKSIAFSTRKYIDEVGRKIKLDNIIYTSGGCVEEILPFKQRLFPNYEFKIVESSSLVGAAKLVLMSKEIN